MVLSQRRAGVKYCTGCDRELDPYEAIKWTVCIECTRMRHRAVLAGHKCVCDPRDRKPHIISNGFRTWVGCDRCLGEIPREAEVEVE